jgi:hypothetical protein
MRVKYDMRTTYSISKRRMSMAVIMVSQEEMDSKKMDMANTIVERLFDLKEILRNLDDSSTKTQGLIAVDSIDKIARDLKDIIYKEALK